MDNPPLVETPKGCQVAALIALQVLMLVTLLVWALAAFLLANIYEGGATPEKHIIFLPILAYPLILLATTIAGWKAYRQGKALQAGGLLLSPLLYGLVYFGYFILMAQSF
ncbi:MAG: hypothetical protein KIS80_05430 [Anaerolineales bacterium]|nr:hypothetical protein [Anaerolineales bacterium]